MRSTIARRLLAYILSISTLLTMALASIVLWQQLDSEMTSIDRQVELMVNASTGPIGRSMWDYDDIQRDSLLQGLLKNEDIASVRLTRTDDGSELYRSPERPGSIHIAVHSTPISFSIYDQTHHLGQLSVYTDYTRAYSELWQNVQVVILFQIGAIALLSAAVFWLIRRLLTRHVDHIARFTDQLTLDQLGTPLTLRRAETPHDELGVLVGAINRMRQRLRQDIEGRALAEQEVRRLNESLEETVAKRTEQLRQRTDELSDTIARLKSMQTQLVEHEKMAALGSLVAGVAHEINTPVGVSVTACSHLNEEILSLHTSFVAGKLTRSAFEQSIDVLRESNAIIGTNLERAANLIRSFKMVAVDQSNEDKRHFKVREYLESVVLALRPRLKKTALSVDLQVDPRLELDSYPGAFSQIFTNLISNSIIHGFDPKTKGTIDIRIAVQDDQLIMDYQDDGRGLEESVKGRLFEPFVTTRRNQGGSGLGMHIVYNVVTQMLRGRIAYLEDIAHGVHFRITAPLDPGQLRTPRPDAAP
jgi:signal transduction histidine kinase